MTDRRQGSTSAILGAALEAASEGRDVVVVAATHAQASELAERVKGLAGGNLTTWRQNIFTTHYPAPNGKRHMSTLRFVGPGREIRQGLRAVVLVDHFAYESLEIVIEDDTRRIADMKARIAVLEEEVGLLRTRAVVDFEESA